MCSRCRESTFIAALLLLAFLVASCHSGQAPTSVARELRVCADPNNLPFSNEHGEGFENRIADLVANELHAKVRYTWWAQRRGFFRNTLKANLCDVVMGVPAGMDMTLTTRPYYRSSYVFVYRSNSGLRISSINDPILRKLKLGVQIIGDDFTNTPPAHALSARHIVSNVSGYTLYGDYAEKNPPARIITAVANGQIDAAIVWGPLAGYFAKLQSTPIEIVPVSPATDGPLPFVFEISAGVRAGEQELRDEIQKVLDNKQAEIRRILESYAIPLL